MLTHGCMLDQNAHLSLRQAAGEVHVQQPAIVHLEQTYPLKAGIGRLHLDVLCHRRWPGPRPSSSDNSHAVLLDHDNASASFVAFDCQALWIATVVQAGGQQVDGRRKEQMVRTSGLPKTFNGWVQARTLHEPDDGAVPNAIATCKQHVAIHCSSDVQGLFGACHSPISSQ